MNIKFKVFLNTFLIGDLFKQRKVVMIYERNILSIRSKKGWGGGGVFLFRSEKKVTFGKSLKIVRGE